MDEYNLLANQNSKNKDMKLTQRARRSVPASPFINYGFSYDIYDWMAELSVVFKPNCLA